MIQIFYLILPYSCNFLTMKQDDLLAARSDARRIIEDEITDWV